MFSGPARHQDVAMRMKQHEANGRAVAEFLAHQPKLSRLAYPAWRPTRSTRWPPAAEGLRVNDEL